MDDGSQAGRLASCCRRLHPHTQAICLSSFISNVCLFACPFDCLLFSLSIDHLIGQLSIATEAERFFGTFVRFFETMTLI